MQILYFPYLQLNNTDEFIIGDVKIWKFDVKSETYIKDFKLRRKVKRLLDTNTFAGKPIKDIPIISIGKIDFRIFSQEETEKIEDARLILFIAILSINNILDHSPNQGHYMFTSENFKIINQNFELENDTITTNEGLLVKKIDFGNKISEIKFPYPLYTPRPYIFKFDDYFIKQMFLLKKNDNNLYKKVLSAIEMFYESYYNTPDLSLNARILLGAGAFEMLLSNPNDNSQFRKIFKEKIKEMLCIENEKIISFISERPNNSKEKEQGSIKIMWGDRFFTLRNHIIHGNNIKDEDFKFKNIQWHFHIIPIFFIAFIHQLINKNRGKVIFKSKIEWIDTNNKEKGGFKFEDKT